MLINPNSNLAKSSKRYSRFVAPLPPIGLAYIASMLEEKGIEVVIEDQFANKVDNSELIKEIKKQMPRIVGFSCLTAVMNNVAEMVREIKSISKDIQIVLGNIHATIFADQLLKKKIADIVVRGEGEHSMLEVALAIEQKKILKNIQGISYSEDGKIYHNPGRALFESLDELPYPAWHLFDLQFYTRFTIIAVYNDIILPIQGSRGCPYQCIFCSQDKMYKKPRYRNIKNILDEIEALQDRYKIKYFGFNDAYFPFSIEQGFVFCDELIKRGLHRRIKWITETRVDLVNLELLKRMKEAGLQLILYGFEVGNQNILDSLKKGTSLQQARMAMEATKKVGISTTGLFMLGLPEETKENCEETIRFAKELDPDIAKFNIAVPLPGSKLFEDYKYKFGDIKDPEKFTSWYDFSLYPDETICVSEELRGRELVNLQRKAMFEFYLRPKSIIKHIIKGTFSFADMFYGAYILISNYLRILLDRLK